MRQLFMYLATGKMEKETGGGRVLFHDSPGSGVVLEQPEQEMSFPAQFSATWGWSMEVRVEEDHRENKGWMIKGVKE